MKTQRTRLIEIVAFILPVLAISPVAFGGQRTAPEVVPLVLGAGALPTPEDLDLLSKANVSDSFDKTGARRITLNVGNELKAQLLVKNDAQEFLVSDITAILSAQQLSQDIESATIYRLEATDSSSGEVASLRLEGSMNPQGAHIRIFVNGKQAAAYSDGENPRAISRKLTRLRMAIAETILPRTLYLLNLFNGPAPENESTITISILSAVSGLTPIFPKAEFLQASPSGSPGPSGPSGSSGSPSGLLANWEQCLMTQCNECGNCWDDTSSSYVVCHRCPDVGIVDGTIVAACYVGTSISCVPKGLAGALK